MYIGTDIKNPSNSPWFSEKLSKGSHKKPEVEHRKKSPRFRHRKGRLSKAIETELLGTEQAVSGIAQPRNNVGVLV